MKIGSKKVSNIQNSFMHEVASFLSTSMGLTIYSDDPPLDMDSAGLVSKEKLLKRHSDSVSPKITRYILVQRTKKIILTEHRDGGLCFTVKQPMEKIDAGTVLEVDQINVVFKTHVARGVIESHCLHLTDDTGWVLGWNTTINGEQVVDMLVTNEDGKPVVVHPVPNHKRRSKHPVTRPSDHDEAAALIQKMTRSRHDRRRRRELAAHPMTRLFGERLLTKNGEQAVLLALEGKTHIGIFFSAQWVRTFLFHERLLCSVL